MSRSRWREVSGERQSYSALPYIALTVHSLPAPLPRRAFTVPAKPWEAS
jgi:hypothetical protein